MFGVDAAAPGIPSPARRYDVRWKIAAAFLVCGIAAQWAQIHTRIFDGQTSFPIRQPTDFFVLGVATVIGLAIGLSLPFFIEMMRTDIPAAPAFAKYAAIKQFLVNDKKYNEKILDEVASREFVKINCLGDRVLEIPISSETTCGDILDELNRMLDLDTGASQYGMFVRLPGKCDALVDSRIPVHAQMVHMESMLSGAGKLTTASGAPLVVDDTAIAASSASDRTHGYEFVFNVFHFPCHRTPLSLVEEDFIFERAMDAFLWRRLPCSANTMARLASLRCQCIFGDYKPTSTTLPDHPYVHPAQIDGLHPPVMQDNKLVAVKGKRRSCATKGKVALGVTYERMSKSEYETTIAGILSKWSQLEGMMIEEARYAFMNIVKEWPFYRHTVFDIKQSTYADWPTNLWFLVGPDNVSFHRKHCRHPLAEFPLEDIESMGAPLPARFHMIIGGKPLDFETKRVLEIALLLKQYCTQRAKLYRSK